MTDYFERNFGDLAPIGQLSNGLFRYRCIRIKPSGEICQNVRDLQRFRAHLYHCCTECGLVAKGHKRGGRKRPTVDFTPEQQERYREILNGREGLECERDAIEMVQIEIRDRLLGACCKLCVERKLESQREVA